MTPEEKYFLIEVREFLEWINDNTELKNHDRDIEHYGNRFMNITSKLPVKQPPKPELCELCRGWGKEKQGVELCSKCNGTGIL